MPQISYPSYMAYGPSETGTPHYRAGLDLLAPKAYIGQGNKYQAVGPFTGAKRS